jgi:hypothetical protein
MLVKKEGKTRYIPMLTQQINRDDAACWDGIVLDDTYELRYRSESNARETSLGKFNGHLMMMHINGMFNLMLDNYIDEVNAFGGITVATRKKVEPLLTLYGTALCDPQRFKKIKKDYSDYQVNTVRKALKNNRKSIKAKRDILFYASIYFYCLLKMERSKTNESKCFSIITMKDTYGDAFIDFYKPLIEEHGSISDALLNTVSEERKKALIETQGFENEEHIVQWNIEMGVLTYEFKEVEKYHSFQSYDQKLQEVITGRVA